MALLVLATVVLTRSLIRRKSWAPQSNVHGLLGQHSNSIFTHSVSIYPVKSHGVLEGLAAGLLLVLSPFLRSIFIIANCSATTLSNICNPSFIVFAIHASQLCLPEAWLASGIQVRGVLDASNRCLQFIILGTYIFRIVGPMVLKGTVKYRNIQLYSTSYYVHFQNID